mmetsp:Transcript_90715/g.228132  ORF Transcript_90715/g.228132 Transcript_90715/m.228132 type:complete len:488 (+) Transcript_90715:13-1476(+)
MRGLHKQFREHGGHVAIFVKGFASAACVFLAAAGLKDVFVVSTAGFGCLRGPRLGVACREVSLRPRLQLGRAAWGEEEQEYVKIEPVERLRSDGGFDLGAIQARLAQETGGKVGALHKFSTNSRVKEATTVREVFAILRRLEEQGDLTAEDYGYALISIRFLRHTIDPFFVNDPAYFRFIAQAKEAIPEAQLDAHTHFMLLFAVNGLRSNAPDFLDLAPTICECFPSDLSTLHWSNMTQALNIVVQLKQDIPEIKRILEPLLQGILDNARNLDTTSMAITMKALGNLDVKRSDIDALVAAILSNVNADMLESFSTRDLKSFTWGLAGLDVKHERMLATIVDIAEDRLDDMGAEINKWEVMSYPMLACALKRLGFMDVQFLETLATHLSRGKHVLRHHLSDWGIAALKWCFPSSARRDYPEVVLQFSRGLDAAMKRRRINPNRLAQVPYGPGYWDRQDGEQSTQQRQRDIATAKAMRRLQQSKKMQEA